VTAGSGPVLRGTDAPAADAGGSRGTARSRSPRLPMMAALARIEVLVMARSVLVLAGLLAGVLLIGSSYWPGQVQPSWWEADWRIGGGQLMLAMTVLARAQLAAGRVRRDNMAGLYASFPAPASTRTLAHLAGLAGAVPASLLVIGAGVVTVQLRDPIGAPSIVVLAAGLVLVIAAGAAGTAIGTWFPHPLAGLFGALALFLPTATGHLIPGWSIWLIPWQLFEDQLGSLPGPLAGYPPAAAHAAELAGVAVLAAIAALMTVRRGRARGWLAGAGAVAVAAICLAGAVQLKPVPVAGLNRLAAEMADPGAVQHCTADNQVRYCLYPGFGGELSSFEMPVNNTLALLPARPARPLTVQQALQVNFTGSLARGQTQQQISRWTAQTRYAPGNPTAASAIYLTAGGWPAAGGYLTDADFNLALATAQWAVGGACPSQACVQDQAREAIAIWLAILAARPPAGELQQGVNWEEVPKLRQQGGRSTSSGTTFIATWAYPTAAGAVTGSGPQ
jgi:hypothetical protein